MLRLVCFIIISLSTATVFALEVPASAKGSGSVENGDPRVEARLIVDADRVPAGETFRVGVLFDVDPEWHVYWRNSGESGFSTEITPAKNEDLEFSEQIWPAPQVYVDPSGRIATFGYARQTLLFFESTLAAEYPHPTVELVVDVDWLACKVDCIPGSLKLSRTLNVGPREQSAQHGLFDRYAAQVPRTDADITAELQLDSPVHKAGETTATLSLTATDAALKVTGGGRYVFIPSEKNQVLWTTTSVENIGGKALLKLAGAASPNGFDQNPCVIDGVVHVQVDGQEFATQVTDSFECSNTAVAVSAPTPAPEATPAPEPEPYSLPYILLLAFLGGLILNLMPCVFPVLAVKVVSFVKLAHEERKTVGLHAAAYTGGIVATMLTLAAVVIGLRTAGTQVGWGFQFQEPVFVAALAAVLVAFAMNLFGVFEVLLGASVAGDMAAKERKGLHRSAAEGVLAVVLATPCSAPFLGTAVGFAFSADDVTIVAVFLMLGLGLALPFVVLTWMPGWTRLLPRPGEWMVVFKHLLGFALLGTTVWLLWILGQSAGNDAVARTLAFLVAIALSTWAWGQIQFGFTPVKRRVAMVLLLGFIGANAAVWLHFDAPPASTATTDPNGMYSPWSDDAVLAAQQDGKAVFVDFTADWCITCKVNENGVLASAPVLAELQAADVVTMKADWTNRNETIRLTLAKYGKAGVPLYLMYPANGGPPQVLPELLTQSIVLDALRLAKHKPVE